MPFGKAHHPHSGPGQLVVAPPQRRTSVADDGSRKVEALGPDAIGHVVLVVTTSIHHLGRKMMSTSDIQDLLGRHKVLLIQRRCRDLVSPSIHVLNLGHILILDEVSHEVRKVVHTDRLQRHGTTVSFTLGNAVEDVQHVLAGQHGLGVEGQALKIDLVLGGIVVVVLPIAKLLEGLLRAHHPLLLTGNTLQTGLGRTRHDPIAGSFLGGAVKAGAHQHELKRSGAYSRIISALSSSSVSSSSLSESLIYQSPMMGCCIRNR